MTRTGSSRARLAARAAGAGLALAWAVLAGAPADASERVLRARLNADIRSTDPGTNRDANTDGVVAHLVEGLVAFGEDTSIKPMLAESWDMSEDGLTYTFHLRQGVKFHNGAVMTADDVVWSLKRYLDPATSWRCLSELTGKGFARIVAVEAPDAHTVQIKLDQPTALFLATLARPDCGQAGILHRDSVAPDGKWIKPVGTGPFKLGEWKRGQYVELERFADYVSRGGPRDGYAGGKTVDIDKVRLSIIPDSSAAKAALVSGSLDVMTGVSPADLDDLKARPEVQLDIAPTLGLVGLLFQVKDPVLKDVRIRKAIALAIDTAQIAEAVTQGTASANNSALPVGSAFYGKVQAEGYKHDVAQARKLLAEAGYAGQPIKMIANKRYPNVFDAAVLVQAMAQAAGIRIEIEVLDWAAQLDRYNKGDYQAMTFIYSARLDASLSFEMLMGPKEKEPRKVWDSPEAQAMLRTSMLTTDKARRQALFDEMHRRFIADAPMVVLFNGAAIAALRKEVKGFKGWPSAQPRYWGVSLQ